MTIVRAPRPGDRDEWLRMRRALWPDGTDEEHLADIDAFLNSEAGKGPASCGFSTGDITAFVAEQAEGGLCGLVEASIRPFVEEVEAKPVGYIEGWYVDLDARRHGVGRALVEAAEGWARSKGCLAMASDVLIDNAVSVESHARLGYREVERLVHFAKDLG